MARPKKKLNLDKILKLQNAKVQAEYLKNVNQTKGDAGVGISGINRVGGNIKIGLTDGQVFDLGNFQGKDGLTPSDEHLQSLIQPLIPVVKDGRDGIDAITPEVGIDYFTEEDILAFKSEVHADLKPEIAKITKGLTDKIDNFSPDDKYINKILKLIPKNPPEYAGGSGATFLKSARDFDVPNPNQRTDGYVITWNATKQKFDLQAGGAGTGTDESVKVSSNDTTAGYLNGKLIAGTNVTFVENNDGANETLTINATGGGTDTTFLGDDLTQTTARNHTINALNTTLSGTGSMIWSSGNDSTTIKNTEILVQDSVDGTKFAINSNGTTEAVTTKTGGLIHEFNASGLTTGFAMQVEANSLTTGIGLQVVSNSSDNSTRNLVRFRNRNSAADNTTVLDIEQDGDARAMFIQRNNSGAWMEFNDQIDTFGFYNNAGTPESVIAADIGSIATDTTNGALYIKTTDTVNTGWTQVGSGGSANTLYSADDALAGNRQVDMSGNTLNFINNSGFSITNGSSNHQFTASAHNITSAAPKNTPFINFIDGTDTTSIASWAGTPEGNVTASLGALALDSSGNKPWYKATGDNTNTGWVQLGETNTSLTYSQGNQALTYTDESGTANSVAIPTSGMTAYMRSNTLFNSYSTMTNINGFSSETNNSAGSEMSLTSAGVRVKAGWYMVSAQADLTSASANVSVKMALSINTVEQSGAATASMLGVTGTRPFSCSIAPQFFQLASNDVVGLMFQRAGAGGTAYCDNSDVYLSLTRLST